VNFDHRIHYMGHAVAQFLEALRYKPEDRGFDSRCCLWNITLTQFFRPHYGPGVDSSYNTNEYQVYFLGGKGGRCLRMTTLQPLCADCLEISELHPPKHSRPVQACIGIALPCLTWQPDNSSVLTEAHRESRC
jgi:hypothetical protein